MFTIENKVAIVTGGANGIGAHIVREFLKENIRRKLFPYIFGDHSNLKRAYRFLIWLTTNILENGPMDICISIDRFSAYVAIVDIDNASGMSLQEEVNLEYGKGRAAFFECDVTKDEQLINVFKKTAAENGSIDLVVNNAGVAFDSLEKYKLTIEINFTAVVTSTLKALNLMRADYGGNGGTIINISSITGLAPTIGAVHIYAATKAAVIQFSNRMGMDLLYSQTKVRVLTVCFGGTDTDLLNNCSGFDDISNKEIVKTIGAMKTQKLQSPVAAARGVVHTYKNGKSASTWLVQNNDISDITNKLKKANETIAEFINFKF